MDRELAKKLLTVSFGTPVTDTLSNFDWDSKPIATVGLEFTPDNRRVARGQFILHGLFTKEPVILQASKLFPEADPDITLTVVIPDGQEFHFNGGTLGSDLLACENFKHHFSKGKRIIFPTQWAANKLGETSMRAVSHLDKTANGNNGPKTRLLERPPLPPPDAGLPQQREAELPIWGRHTLPRSRRHEQRQAPHAVHEGLRPHPAVGQGPHGRRESGEGALHHVAKYTQTSNCTR